MQRKCLKLHRLERFQASFSTSCSTTTCAKIVLDSFLRIVVKHLDVLLSHMMAKIFLLPILALTLSFAAWVAWLGLLFFIFYSYMETLNHANYHDWLHFYLPPYTREKKTIWTLLGSNPGRLCGKRLRYPLLHASRAHDG